MSVKRLSNAQGFTLIEVLIALSLFAILSVMAFGGLKQLLGQHQQLDARTQRFSNLQSAVQVLERDLSQIEARTVRDSFGDIKSALMGSAMPEFVYELTTKNWINPHDATGVLLQRIGYQIQENTLWRSYYPKLDAGIGNTPVRYGLLKEITDFKLRFMGSNGAWVEFWPPLNDTGQTDDTQVPNAIEMSLSAQDFGTITKIIEVVQSEVSP